MLWTVEPSSTAGRMDASKRKFPLADAKPLEFSKPPIGIPHRNPMYRFQTNYSQQFENIDFITPFLKFERAPHHITVNTAADARNLG